MQVTGIEDQEKQIKHSVVLDLGAVAQEVEQFIY